MRNDLFRAFLSALLLTMSVCTKSEDASRVIDVFDSVSNWSAIGAGAAKATVIAEKTRNGSSMRIDFDFTQGGGEVMVHKSVPMTLPENYAITLKLKGKAAYPLELRLIDDSGKNVWRYSHPEFSAPLDWQPLRVKQRQFAFAWGPAEGDKPQKLGLVEFVIGRGPGGKGTLWIDDLKLEPRQPDQAYSGTPVITASGALTGRDARNLLNESSDTGWHSLPNRQPAWLQLDFGMLREYGGLIIDWDPKDYAAQYQVEQSDDGQNWQRAYTVSHGNGQRDYLPLPEAESRFLRLRMDADPRGIGYGIRRLEIAPLAFTSSNQPLFERMAHDATRGLYPRYLLGEQPYWTVAGSAGTPGSGAKREALLSTDGQVESDEGAFSIEPYLYSGGKLLTWADGTATPSLANGYLPIPSVSRTQGELELSVSLLNPKASNAPFLARYQVTHHGQQPIEASLFLVVSPFLVNPPWQSLAGSGGISSIHQLSFRKDAFWIEGHPRVIALTRPDQGGVAGFDQYPIAADIAQDSVPRATSVNDALGKATGALRYAFSIAPGAQREIILALPDTNDKKTRYSASAKTEAHPLWSRQYQAVVEDWERQLNQVTFRLPADGAAMARAVQSTLAYILINRDGPAIRPGARRYNRTWIRDAAVTSSALLALGHEAEVGEFLRWFGPYQGSDGSIPCCLDPWGPDAMVEHDSVGEFIYTLANYYRYSGDRGLLEALWPRVMRSVEYLIALREKRLGPDYSQGEANRFRGLLPESASHEGYMSHPVHSYWDDYWAIRGLADAAWLAGEMQAPDKAARYAAVRDAMQSDVERSIELTQKHFNIDFAPASADLGDFDPTSTAIAPILGLGADSRLFPALQTTFKRYFAEVQARTRGVSNWKAYAPYEFRSVSAMVRLGEREAANATIKSLMTGRRPAEWNQWPEVAWRDERPANFIGDLPHTWVGAEFIQAFLSLFAYENSGDQLVLAAGLPRAWVEAPGGVGIQGLHTAFGVLGYHLESSHPGETQVHIEALLRLPSKGLVINPPLPQAATGIELNGKPVSQLAGPLVIHELPAHVRFRHGSDPLNAQSNGEQAKTATAP